MAKFSKLATSGAMLAIVFSAASCGPKADLIFWTGFGSSYTTAITALTDAYKAETGVYIEHQSQGGYEKLQSNLLNTVSTASYPNFANGYPDHFASYIGSSIMLPLDDFITKYEASHPGVHLVDDYYSQYMKENTSLMFDSKGKGFVMGLPFNKSTEVMAYNSYFVDYAKSLDSSVTIPETWLDLENVGPKYLDAMENLYGKILVGVTDAEGNASQFAVVNSVADKPLDKEILLDCSTVTREKFRLMCWDSADNMFITLVRQWGSEYTTYTAADRQKNSHGHAAFYTGEKNKARTIAALQYFNETLYQNKLFGLPSDVSDDSYSSTAFKGNSTMFVVCSSGGLSYNISETRIKFAPIPYMITNYEGEGEVHQKYVISQGTNLGLFDQGTEEAQMKAFEAMVEFTTGAKQAQWAVTTGYYPSSKSATNHELYQALLTQPQDDPTKRAYKESAILNEEIYMNETEGWDKFVDPGFVGSSFIRSEVKTIMGSVFGKVNDKATDKKTYDQILQETYNRLKDFAGS